MVNKTNSKNDIEGAMYMAEINSIRIEKLGNKVTIFFILMLCLISIVLFFAYMNINEKLANVDITGKTQAKTISDTLETKINSMIVDMAKLKHMLDIKLPEMEKNTDSLNKNFSRLASLKADKNYVKIEKKKIAASVDTLKKKLRDIDKANAKNIYSMNKAAIALKKNMKELGLSLKKAVMANENSIKKEITKLDTLKSAISGIQKNILVIEQKIKILSQEKIGKKEFNTKLETLKKEYKEKLNTLILRYETTTNTGKKTTRANYENKGNTPGKTKLKLSTKAKSAVSKTNKSSLKSPADKAVKLPEIQPGKIIEQNLSQ